MKIINCFFLFSLAFNLYASDLNTFHHIKEELNIQNLDTFLSRVETDFEILFPNLGELIYAIKWLEEEAYYVGVWETKKFYEGIFKDDEKLKNLFSHLPKKTALKILRRFFKYKTTQTKKELAWDWFLNSEHFLNCMNNSDRDVEKILAIWPEKEQEVRSIVEHLKWAQQYIINHKNPEDAYVSNTKNLQDWLLEHQDTTEAALRSVLFVCFKYLVRYPEYIHIDWIKEEGDKEMLIKIFDAPAYKKKLIDLIENTGAAANVACNRAKKFGENSRLIFKRMTLEEECIWRAGLKPPADVSFGKAWREAVGAVFLLKNNHRNVVDLLNALLDESDNYQYLFPNFSHLTAAIMQIKQTKKLDAFQKQEFLAKLTHKIINDDNHLSRILEGTFTDPSVTSPLELVKQFFLYNEVYTRKDFIFDWLVRFGYIEKYAGFPKNLKEVFPEYEGYLVGLKRGYVIYPH